MRIPFKPGLAQRGGYSSTYDIVSRNDYLFASVTDQNQGPTSFAVSILIHSFVIGLLSLGFMYRPVRVNRVRLERYSVRHLDLLTHEPQTRVPAGDRDEHGLRSTLDAHALSAPVATHLQAARQITDAETHRQTLLQPDSPTHLALPDDMQIPAFILWTPSKTLVKVIVAPLPEKPTTTDVTPSLNMPNEELRLADLAVSSSDLPAPRQPILPAVTSPVVARGPELSQLPPVTISQSSDQPTPAAVISLSDIRVDQGIVTLPPVNQTAAANSHGPLAPGQAQDSAPSATNQHAEASGKSNEGSSGSAPGTDSDFGQGPLSHSTQITLPKDGHFGSVVVGASLDDQFPEIAGVWSDRLAYTVYLHVGMGKGWILQYSLPRPVEAAEAGNVARLEAPWPYNIVRPDLPPDSIETDALIIRGFISQDGRFEALRLIFPPAFPQAGFVLHCLQQWQFRPASQNQQPAQVEVLLIIPGSE